MESPPPELTLLGGFELRLGPQTVALPAPAQRVLAFLALADRPVERSHLAGTLWLDATEEHAAGSLRSALWRIRRVAPGAVAEASRRLALSPAVEVDLRLAVAWAGRVCGEGPLAQEDVDEGIGLGDLLPDWYEDWVLIERERLLQLHLHALERLCERLAETGRFGPAIEVGLAAVRHDPLRQSAHRAVMRAHLAEGNRGEALRQQALYRTLVTGSGRRVGR